MKSFNHNIKKLFCGYCLLCLLIGVGNVYARVGDERKTQDIIKWNGCSADDMKCEKCMTGKNPNWDTNKPGCWVTIRPGEPSCEQVCIPIERKPNFTSQFICTASCPPHSDDSIRPPPVPSTTTISSTGCGNKCVKCITQKNPNWDANEDGCWITIRPGEPTCEQVCTPVQRKLEFSSKFECTASCPPRANTSNNVGFSCADNCSKCTLSSSSTGAQGCTMTIIKDSGRCESTCVATNEQPNYFNERYMCGICPSENRPSIIIPSDSTSCSTDKCRKCTTTNRIEGCTMSVIRKINNDDSDDGKERCESTCVTRDKQPNMIKERFFCGICPSTSTTTTNNNNDIVMNGNNNCREMKKCSECTTDELKGQVGCFMALKRKRDNSSQESCEQSCVPILKQSNWLKEGGICGKCTSSTTSIQCTDRSLCAKCKTIKNPNYWDANKDGCYMSIRPGTTSCEQVCIPYDKQILALSKEFICGGFCH